MTDNTDYSGDVTLTGTEDAPVQVHRPEDMFFRMESIGGDLEIQDAEYVYTHQPVSGDAGVGVAETVVRGTLEDAYAKTGGVDGDCSVVGVDDVFIPADAVDGEISVHAAENVFSTATPESLPAPGEYDLEKTGWKQDGYTSDPDTGVYITGAKHDVVVEEVQTDITVYVVGWNHDIEINGRDATVELVFCGRDNSVKVGPYLEAKTACDAGHDNHVYMDDYPTDDLIETTKDDAFPFFGRRKVTWQEPADDDEWCPNCGESADAIIARHNMDAFFLFGKPVHVFEKSETPARECEHCSMNAIDPSLSEDERTMHLG